MDQNLAILLIMAVAIAAAVILTLGTTRQRTRRRVAELTAKSQADAATAEQLVAENEHLRGRVTQQEERLRVLERIATDPAERTAREIEQLRN